MLNAFVSGSISVAGETYITSNVSGDSTSGYSFKVTTVTGVNAGDIGNISITGGTTLYSVNITL